MSRRERDWFLRVSYSLALPVEQQAHISRRAHVQTLGNPFHRQHGLRPFGAVMFRPHPCRHAQTRVNRSQYVNIKNRPLYDLLAQEVLGENLKAEARFALAVKAGEAALVSPVTSKPASQGRIKTSHSEGLHSYQVS